MDSSLAGFHFYLLQNRKASTARTHVQALKRLLPNVQPFTKENLNIYFLSLKEKGCTNKYLNNLIDSVCVYTEYLGEKWSLHRLKEESFVKATMSDNEIEQFLSLPAKRKGSKEILNHARWTLFFSIMAFSGMRPGEIAGLTSDRVDFGRSVFSLEDTKTNTPRLVPIAPNLQKPLQEHVGALKGVYLFPSLRGGTEKGLCVDSVDWHYNFHTRIKRMGLKRKNLSPYSLRHSFITRLLEEDVAFPKVMKIAGHKRAETTLIYSHMTTKDIQLAVSKHPLVRRFTHPQEILKSIVEMVKSYAIDQDSRFAFSINESEKELSIKLTIK